jgi:hypothetical protein
MAASWYYYSPLLRMCLSVSLLFLCHLCLLGVRILGSEQQLLWQFRRFILIFFSLYDCKLGSDQVGDADARRTPLHDN